MRIILPVLQNEFRLIPQFEKLEEEVKEVNEAIEDIHNAKFIGREKEMYGYLTSEVIDVMQVCVGLLDHIEQMYPKMVSEVGKHHPMKLNKKNYRFKSILILESD